MLASTLPDVAVTLVGPWSTLTAERRSPLDDPLLDLRLARGTYEHDGRVVFVEEAEEDSAPAMFRLRLPAGWVPGADSLRRLTADADTDCAGVVCVVLDDPRERPEDLHGDPAEGQAEDRSGDPAEGQAEGRVVARLERTAAVTRARLLAAEGEDLDDVVRLTFGVRWTDGGAWGFLPAGEAPAPSTVRVEAEAARLRSEAAKWRAEADRWEAEAAKRGGERRPVEGRGRRAEG